ncbi:hypothetical protein ACQR53_19330 [Xanthomonas oryzae]|uniref:Uncharacterized protein n=1 Tax=Xanthomonas oryzae pv. leersiae TaxID=3112258 RepID=A0AAJ6KLT4_9XANT|nr:hypothetical protein [Xanthomonas oryzae]WIX06898.1 hypothetical protein QN060_01435 [Xanthomonas oryzae pv. oryzae]
MFLVVSALIFQRHSNNAMPASETAKRDVVAVRIHDAKVADFMFAWVSPSPCGAPNNR